MEQSWKNRIFLFTGTDTGQTHAIAEQSWKNGIVLFTDTSTVTVTDTSTDTDTSTFYKLVNFILYA